MINYSPPKYLFITLAFLSFLFMLTGCDGGIKKSPVSENEISYLEISPVNTSYAKGAVINLAVTVHFDDGTKINLQDGISWSSSAIDIVSVSGGGVLSTISAGEAIITAKYDGNESSETIVVTDSVLLALKLESSNTKVVNGSTFTMTAFAIFSNGSKLDVTEQIEWSVEDSLNVRVTEGNQFYASDVGTVSINGSYQNLETSIDIEVLTATLQKIEIITSAENFLRGTDIELRAWGVFSNDIRQDISEGVNWEFSNNSTVNYVQTDNRLNLIAVGNVRVTARAGEIISFKDIKISAPDLVEINIYTQLKSLPSGEIFILRADGLYNNGDEVDITKLVEWLSADDSVAEVSNALNSEGRALGKAPGIVELSASLNGVSALIQIELLGIQLNELQVTLPRQTLALGTIIKLAATGIYSDGSDLLLTDKVAWSSDNDSIITVYNGSAKVGQVEALSVGTTQITAVYEGVTSTVEITVTDAELQELVIDIDRSMPVETSVQASVVGVFTDGRRQNLTEQVTWGSSDTAVIDFQNVISQPGAIISRNAGQAQLSVSFSGISKATTITVVDIVLEGIQVAIDNPAIGVNTSSRIYATGIYSNGLSRDITNIVLWASSNLDIASVDNSTEIYKILGISSGDVTISASIGSMSQELVLSVIAATLVNINITPQNINVVQDDSYQLRATAEYSDGRVQDITDNVLWQSSDSNILFISNEDSSKGEIYALEVGEVEISLSSGGASTTVTVSEATLEAINISYEGSNILASGYEKQLLATGVYSNGRTSDITRLVTWQTDDSNVCRVSNFEQEYGLLVGVSKESCTVVARMGDLNSSTFFEITDAKLLELIISPVEVSIALGTSMIASATGRYSDGSFQELTNLVTWTSDNSAIYVGNSIVDQAEIRGIGLGQGLVTAMFEELSSTLSVVVTEAVLESIIITPALSTLAEGLSQQLIATGYYSNETSQIITGQVIWRSADNSIAIVSNENDSAGRLDALAAGVVGISAELDDISGVISSLEIINDPTAPFSVSLVASPFVILNDGSDSTTIDISVNAIDSLSVVADGTQVNIVITSGDEPPSEQSLFTVNGSVSFEFSSTYSGVVSIHASIENRPVEGVVYILSVADLSRVIGRNVTFSGSMNDGVVASGSEFGFLLLNYSNREFSVDNYAIFNDGNLLANITDPSILNNNSLDAGEFVFVVFVTDEARGNSYAALYQLTDAATGTSFYIGRNLVLK